MLELWKGADSHLLPVYIRTYFPELYPPDKAEPLRLFHDCETEEEKNFNRQTRTACFRFMRDVQNWESARADASVRDVCVLVSPLPVTTSPYLSLNLRVS